MEGIWHSGIENIVLHNSDKNETVGTENEIVGTENNFFWYKN